MALTIDIPGLSSNLTEPRLVEKLYDMSSQIESYVLSFFIIAMFWVSYHQVFNHIKDSCLSMVYLNLFFLLLITLLSISTSLVITFDSYQIAYLIYYGVVITASTLLVVIWWYAIRINAVGEKPSSPVQERFVYPTNGSSSSISIIHCSFFYQLERGPIFLLLMTFYYQKI